MIRLATLFQKILVHGARSGRVEFCTWVTLGVKAQRMISAKFTWVRAPMISAPIIEKRISPYMARAEKRVKAHMSISKFRPRRRRGRVRGLEAMSDLQRRAYDDDDGDRIEGQEDRPLHPDGLALV